MCAVFVFAFFETIAAQHCTQMLKDAYENNCDIAYLVSGDSDIVPPIDDRCYIASRIDIISSMTVTSREFA